MARLSNELRKAVIHMKDDGYSTSRIKKTLEDRVHQMSRGCLYDLFNKFSQHHQIEELKKKNPKKSQD